MKREFITQVHIRQRDMGDWFWKNSLEYIAFHEKQGFDTKWFGDKTITIPLIIARIGLVQKFLERMKPQYENDLSALELVNIRGNPNLHEGFIERKKQLEEAYRGVDPVSYYNAIAALEHFVTYRGKPVPPNVDQNLEELQGTIVSTITGLQTGDYSVPRNPFSFWRKEFKQKHGIEQETDKILPVESMPFARYIIEYGSYTPLEADNPHEIDKFRQAQIERLSSTLKGIKEQDPGQKLEVLLSLKPQPRFI